MGDKTQKAGRQHKNIYTIHRKALGYGGMEEDSRFPYWFLYKKDVKEMLQEIAYVAAEEANKATEDHYETKSKKAGEVIVVDDPDAEKDWYWQEFSIIKRTRSVLSDPEYDRIYDSEYLVKDKESVPVEAVEAIERWVTPDYEERKGNGAKQGSNTASNWDLLGSEEWIQLLVTQPQFAEKCNKWSEFNCDDWLGLLKEQPQFSDKCEKYGKLDEYGWPDLLVVYPQFADKCDKWEEFDGYAWSKLLKAQPQFSDKCDKWEEFEATHWVNLLVAQPQFAKKCDKWAEFCVWSWRSLLKAQPQFADKCDKLDEFGASDWFRLLAVLPQFADKCDEWESFDSEEWCNLLMVQPQFADKCDEWESFDSEEWCNLLKVQPQFADKCDAWEWFDEKDLGEMFSKTPSLKKFLPLSNFDSRQIVVLLTSFPECADEVGKWADFDASDWCRLLAAQPQFADKCDKWSEFDVADWCRLLAAQPQFAIRFDKWDKFTVVDWENLLTKRPEFIDKCSIEKLKPYKENNFRSERIIDPWKVILEGAPSLADRCDWASFGVGGLDQLTKAHRQKDSCGSGLNSKWFSLLSKQPILASYAPWDRLRIDLFGWKEFVMNDLKTAGVFAVYMDEMTRQRLVDISSWAKILSVSPELADFFESQKKIRK